MSTASTLKCLECGREYPLDRVVYNCESRGGRGLFHGTVDVVYDYEDAKERLSRGEIEARPPGVWRYVELLPVLDESNIVTMGEGEPLSEV